MIPTTVRSTIAILACAVLVPLVGGCAGGPASPRSTVSPAVFGDPPMSLGNFSVSLTVKDLAASRQFYETLGFRPIGGDGTSWQILQSDTATIGLFQGMFERNTLTFNPGWDRAGGALPAFTDVRELQRQLKAKGLTITTPTDDTGTGPAFITLVDPDGNPVLIDQHVPAPAR